MIRSVGKSLALRRASQLILLTIFVVLFRKTAYSGTDGIPYAINIFFRADPLLAISAILAFKSWIPAVAPALVIIVSALVAGRVFCGWLCPLGTLLDLVSRLFPAAGKSSNPSLRTIKYAILIFLLVAAVLELQVAGLFDPLAILVRGMTFSMDPAWYAAVTTLFTWLYDNAPPAVTFITEPIYLVFRAGLIPHGPSFFVLAGFSLAILLVICGFESVHRRFWCKNLCPLGALLALLSRFSLLRKKPAVCKLCDTCRTQCRMEAIDSDGRVMEDECIRCMTCQERCPQKLISFGFGRQERSIAGSKLSRRTFLGAVVSGIAIPMVRSVDPRRRFERSEILRPPGALDEKSFMNLCVRCGECMKVCIGNALQPAFLEAGPEGLFTPMLVPRIGYCEYYCTLCGEVCPTGALQRLDRQAKLAFIIGTARIDKARCLPFADKTPCLVCEEHCPTHDKAIKLRRIPARESGLDIDLLEPWVDTDLCIGCGICETKCPVPGPAAIIIGPKAVPRPGGGVYG